MKSLWIEIDGHYATEGKGRPLILRLAGAMQYIAANNTEPKVVKILVSDRENDVHQELTRKIPGCAGRSKLPDFVKQAEAIVSTAQTKNGCLRK